MRDQGSAAVSVVTLCQTPDLHAVTQFLDCGRRWPSSVHLWIPDKIILKVSEVVEKATSYASVTGKSSVFTSVVENAVTHFIDGLFPISPTSLRIQYQVYCLLNFRFLSHRSVFICTLLSHASHIFQQTRFGENIADSDSTAAFRSGSAAVDLGTWGG